MATMGKKLQIDPTSSVEVGLGIGNVIKTTFHQNDVSIFKSF